MSILDTAEYRRLALIAAGVDPCDIPCILDTAAWRRLMLKALYDLSQGGGGSPGYINGSVQFYTDLPVTVGTPAVNTAYLVRENSGVWFINRKPAGIYVRLFNNGNLNDWDYAGTFPEVNDAQYFRIYDSADPTREVAFNVSGVAAATTRTVTMPDADVMLPDQGTSTTNAPSFTGLTVNGTSDTSPVVTIYGAQWFGSVNGNQGVLYQGDIAGKVKVIALNRAFSQYKTLELVSDGNVFSFPSGGGTLARTSDIPAAFNPASPGTIGGTTPAAGTFTDLKADSLVLPKTGAPLISFQQGGGIVSASIGGLSVQGGSSVINVASGQKLELGHGSSLQFSSGATIVDPNNNTKKAALDLSGITAGQTRTLSVPNTSGTIAVTSDFATPPAIGSTTPAAGSFTNLSASAELQLPTNAPASPSAGDLYRVSDTLRYRDGTNAERLLLNATDNLSNLDNTATARTNLGVGSSSAVTFGSIQNTPIGSTTPAAGSFTNLLASAELTVPAVTPASPSTGDLYRTTDMLRYRDSSNTERILLNNLDNLANLSNTATARTNIGLGSANDVTFGSIQNTPIGSTTRNSGAFTTLSANNGTITASAPVLSLSQTWNNAATTFTGLQFDVTNTASATSSLVARFTVGSTNVFEVDGRGFTKVRKVATTTDFVPVFEVLRGTTSVVRLRDDGDVNATSFGITTAGNVIINSGGVGILSTGRLGFGSDTFGGNTDTELRRDASDTLAQRRLANPQTFRLYNTTDAGLTNYERGFMRWSSNVFQIGTEKAGTGSARGLRLVYDGNAMLDFSSAVFFSATCNLQGNIITNVPQLDFNWGTGGGGSLFPGLAAGTIDQRGGTTAQVFRIYSTSSSANANFERLVFAGQSSASFFIDTQNGGTGSTRGLDIRTGGTARISISSGGGIGFYGAAAAAQPAAVADATDAATVITQLNALLSRLRTIGIIAT